MEALTSRIAVFEPPKSNNSLVQGAAEFFELQEDSCRLLGPCDPLMSSAGGMLSVLWNRLNSTSRKSLRAGLGIGRFHSASLLIVDDFWTRARGSSPPANLNLQVKINSVLGFHLLTAICSCSCSCSCPCISRRAPSHCHLPAVFPSQLQRIQ
jgi:hypothetical protein